MDAINHTGGAGAVVAGAALTGVQGAPQVFAMRAYGGLAAPRAAAQVVQPAPPAPMRMPTKAQRLVAAPVPGSINFTTGTDGAFAPAASASASGGALPMYRNPADKNAAAVGVEAGRTLDVEG